MRLAIVLVFSYLHFASSSPNSGARKFNSRTILCPSQDDTGSSLIGHNFHRFTCMYDKAGLCQYSSDGRFSSGTSICPNALLAQNVALQGSPDSSRTTQDQSPSQTSAAGGPVRASSTSSSTTKSISITQDPSLSQTSANSTSLVSFTSSTTIKSISISFTTGSSTIDQGTEPVPVFTETGTNVIGPLDSPSTSISRPVHKPNNVPIIAGSAVGAMVVIAVVIGTLMIRRCCRTRMLNLEISRYEPSIVENTSIRPAIFSRKQYMNIDDSTENIDESSGTHDRQIQSEKDPTASNPVTFSQRQTERQRSLQEQAVQIERQIADSEAVLNSVDASPEFTRALMEENIRLNVEIQALRDLNRSDWARGLTDVPPPSYPHSEASSL